MKNLLNIATLKKSLILIPLVIGLISPIVTAGEKKKTEREKQIFDAKNLAIQFAKQALDKLDADSNAPGEMGRKHLDLQLDRVTPVSVDVLKKLSDPRLKINFPEPHEAESPGCKKMQQEMQNEKAIQESKRRHEHDHDHMEDYEDYDRREHQGALNVLAYVDNKSDWEIHICHAYFRFPNRMDPDPNPLQSKKEARAQILIHEAIHLVLGHTHDKQRTFGEKEKECSWYTYEHMIHSNLNEFYEDGYYTMFGFNLQNFKYHGVVP